VTNNRISTLITVVFSPAF